MWTAKMLNHHLDEGENKPHIVWPYRRLTVKNVHDCPVTVFFFDVKNYG